MAVNNIVGDGFEIYIDQLQLDELMKLMGVLECGKGSEIDVDEALISQVREHRLLYDQMHEFYDNKKKTRRLWVKIAKSIKLDVATTQSRWQELLETFRLEYLGFPALQATSDKETTKFVHYDKMLWIVPHICACLKTEPTDTSETEVEDQTLEENDCTTVSTLPVENKSDYHFMMSVIEELRNLSPATRFQFKKRVLDVLETCVLKDKGI